MKFHVTIQAGSNRMVIETMAATTVSEAAMRISQMYPGWTVVAVKRFPLPRIDGHYGRKP